MVIDALETLMAHAIEQETYQIGFDAGQKLLSLEPWAETAYRQLMKLFALNGQRGRALQQYKTCCTILAKELGVEPMAETTALYRHIQSGQVVKVRNSLDLVTVPAPNHSPASNEKRDFSQATGPTLLSEDGAGNVTIPSNLLTPLSAFIGRQAELTYLVEQLTKRDCRLVTILGPGGVGKSSLALALGQRLLNEAKSHFPDGIFFVPPVGVEVNGAATGQQPINPPHTAEHDIITSIAEAIGCQFQGGRPLQAQLIDYLQHRRLLLILDNFEYLVEEAAIPLNVLQRAPTVTIIVTSRTRLNIRGEITLLLNGLSFSSSASVPLLDSADNSQGNAVQISEAIALFVDRAQHLHPSFALDAETIGPITQICQAVAGLPLAIEMTAGWTTLYSCAEIAERLKSRNERNELLTSQFQDQPERHQNLQQVFNDSWNLLSAQLQWALAKVSIFSSQFTRTAAQAIADITICGCDLAKSPKATGRLGCRVW